MGYEICGKLANKLYNRGYGIRRENCIELRGEEYLYLVGRGIIKDDFKNTFLSILNEQEDFDIRYFVYRDLFSDNSCPHLLMPLYFSLFVNVSNSI